MTRIDRRAFMAVSAASAAVIGAGSRVQAKEAGWTARASLPWMAQEIYAAVHEGKIVTAGGLVMRRGQPLHVEDRVGAYDPAADAWSELPRLPEARHHPMIVSAGEAGLYALGGYARVGGDEWVNTTDCLVLEGDSWRPMTPIPAPLSETVGACVDGRIHLIGGRTPGGSANGDWNDQADTPIHRVFIPAENRWTDARPLPMARNSAAAAVLDGAIWVAGGRTVGGGGTGRLDRYDPAADRWDTLAPIPRSYAQNSQVGGGLAMAPIGSGAGGKLVAFGGEWFARGGGGGVFAETWIYDPARDAWAAGPDMKTPRHGLAAAAVDGAVYAIAGGAVVSGGQAVGVVERFTL
ncbi:Kelch repeat-containing protein [Brevundimonas sp. GCM10030266]|uniref:Kelch repeat-containing protein n=1 Tax=Brevundimonas sp. GCM10030266 TaxID=3273386 RepID=UPI00360667E0